MMKYQRIAALSAVLAMLAVVALAGCGSSSSQTNSKTTPKTGSTTSHTAKSTGQEDTAAAAAVPASIRSHGVLTVAINGIFPPMEYVNPGSTTLQGFDVDFATALAKEVGLKVKFDNQQFAQLTNSVQTGRDDVIISGFTDTAEREQVLNFIDYFKTGTQAFVLANQAGTIKSLSDLCGKTMAMSAATTYVTDLRNWSSKNCVAKGKQAINILGVDSEPTARLQMTQGRAVASAIGPEELVYLNKQASGQFKAVGPILNPGPYGIALTKKETGLEKALLLGFKAMFADGTYHQILAKWGLSREAVSQPTVNSPHA